MALTSVGTWDVDITLKDRDGNPGKMSVRYAGALLASAVEAEVTGQLIPAIQGLSDAVVTEYSIRKEYIETDQLVLNSAPESSDVERKAVFGYKTSYRTATKLEVPSIKNTLVVDGSNILNMADPLVVAFIAVTGPTVPGATTPLDPAAGPIVFSGKAAEKIHRKSTKG